MIELKTQPFEATDPENEISLLYVTSDQASARGLSRVLRSSSPGISVKWISPDLGRSGRLEALLASQASQGPLIVMLDFNSLGILIWQLVWRCSALLPNAAMEWFVVNYHGRPPRLKGTLWENVTILADKFALN